MATRRALQVLGLLLVSAAAQGVVVPGDLFVPEVSAGTVVNVRGGGDFVGAPRFATGLNSPTSICFGPGASVYVSVVSQVVAIDDGGDLSGATPFATGLPGDGRLGCTGSEILLGSGPTGEVFDVTAGGDFSAAVPFATGLSPLGGIFRDSGGTLWASLATGEIFDISAGGDFSAATPFATASQAAELTEHAGMLLVASGNQVVDFTSGGDLSLAPIFASNLDARGLLAVPGLGLFSASGSGSGVWEISAGGDFSGAPPFASGVATTFGLASLAFVHGCGDGVVDAGEECDDGNQLNGDTCDASCALGVPEPTHALLLAVGALTLGGSRAAHRARA